MVSISSSSVSVFSVPAVCSWCRRSLLCCYWISPRRPINPFRKKIEELVYKSETNSRYTAFKVKQTSTAIYICSYRWPSTYISCCIFWTTKIYSTYKKGSYAFSKKRNQDLQALEAQGGRSPTPINLSESDITEYSLKTWFSFYKFECSMEPLVSFWNSFAYSKF